MFGVFFWDPAREMCSYSLPLLGRPIVWYGFFFAIGFFFGYILLERRLRSYFLEHPFFVQQDLIKKISASLAEKAFMYIVIGVIIGARLADVFFYQNCKELLRDPLLLFRVWEGGLSSHGGAFGALIACFFFFYKEKKQMPGLPFVGFLDFLCIPTAFLAGCIRIGNFFNQEILGVCTTLPFGVVFGHPADGGPLCPRHPVQIYESLFYFSMIPLFFLYQKKVKDPGKITGLFLMLVFGFRIMIEWLKVEQSVLLHSSFFTMGQLLSIPFFLLGLFLFFCKKGLRSF